MLAGEKQKRKEAVAGRELDVEKLSKLKTSNSRLPLPRI
jgi:hypothetical protein